MLNSKSASLFLLLMAFFIVNSNGHNHICEQWKVTDLDFVANPGDLNPFTVDFHAVFSHESGRVMKVPGFYDGDNRWIIRVCPDLTGEWKYETSSILRKLDGKSGKLVVNENRNPDEHGPILISQANPRKFEYADGTPYFLMAFELDWLFALDAENPDDIPLTREMTGHIEENRFNHVVMNVYAYDATWGKRMQIRPEHNFSAPRVFPFGGTNGEPDYSTLNVTFFQRLDRVMAHLGDQGMISHLMIYVWNKMVNWPEPGTTADNMYFDYVVKRYQAYPNLMWDISKEALSYGRDDMSYITGRIQRLRELDGHDRLITVHDYKYCRNHPDEVDYISIQDWMPDIYSRTVDVMERHPGKPVFNIEHGGYERTMDYEIFDGSFNDAVVCLDRNYKILFAGAYSTYYWQNTAWFQVIYNPQTLSEREQPKFEYYKFLSKFFERYPYEKLKPFNANNTYCLSDHNNTFLFYLPEGMIRLTGSLPMSAVGKEAALTWFDPLTGEYSEGEDQHFNSGPWIGFHRPEKFSGGPCIAILELKTRDRSGSARD